MNNTVMAKNNDNPKAYPSISDAIFLCAIFLGIQLGIEPILRIVSTILLGSDMVSITSITAGLSEIIGIGVVLWIGVRK